MERKYAAFISYRHASLDMTTAKTLHFKEFLIVVSFGYASVAKIFLIVFVYVSGVCCFHFRLLHSIVSLLSKDVAL